MSSIITRTYYQELLIPYRDTPIIKVLTGMRRVGKTFCLMQYADSLLVNGVNPQQILLINKEDKKRDHITDDVTLYDTVTEYFSSLGVEKKYLFIDEIQDIKQREKTIRSLCADHSYDIMITGSNSTMLSSELATYLTGRYIQIHIYPLSYREFVDFFIASNNFTNHHATFALYLKVGGMPFLHHLDMNTTVTTPYLRDIVYTIMYKDIITRYNLKKGSILETLYQYMADVVCTPFIPKNISAYLKSHLIRVDNETVREYMRYITDSYLAYQVPKYDIKAKKRFEFVSKYYLSDHGIKNALIGIDTRSLGQNLEQIVYFELCRRGRTVSFGSLPQGEVDFVAEKDGKKWYIQVAYLLASDETVRREFGVLEQINDHFPKLVLSMDQLFGQSRDGVQWCNVIEWLLKEES